MAAECEINYCGVLAVGRCATCGRAFCSSHRSPDWVDQCSECRTASYKAAADASHEADRREARAKEQIQAIARQLMAAGHAPDCFLREGKREKERLFGGYKEVRDRNRDVYGWFVGEYTWREREAGMYGGDRKAERRVKTYVTSDGRDTAKS